jgi:hypothetical protein
MTQIELMPGSKAVKAFVNTYLEKDLPKRLVDYRNGWNLDDESLPEPLLYLPYEPVALDTWPTVITVALSSSDYTRVDYAESWDPMYRVVYAMRTYVWVRDDDAELATEMRDNLCTVMRTALLDHQCLQTAANVRKEVLIDESSMREEYSDLTLLKGDRVMCGAYIAYNLNLNEVVARATVGAVSGWDLDFKAIEDDAT